MMAAGYVVRLQTAGRLAEAWRYVGELLKVLPGAYSFMAASITTFWRAADAIGDERQDRFLEQFDYFDRAWAAYRELTTQERSDLDVRLFMSFCFDAALVALVQLGNSQRALAVAGEAIEFNPNSPLPFAMRGVLTYPSQAAVTDFRRGALLSGADYVPFYYLAHHAFHLGKLGEAEQLCRGALARNPGPRARAQLTAWLAVFRDSAGAPKDEVEALFRQAFDFDPDSEQVANLYDAFKGNGTTSTLAKQEAPIERFNEWNIKNDTSASWANSPHGVIFV